MTANTSQTLRSQQALQDEIDALRYALKEQQTALSSAQLSAQRLALNCQALVELARAHKIDSDVVAEAAETIACFSGDDSAWITELRTEAFERGFKEGYVYAFRTKRTLTEHDDGLSHYQNRVAQLWPAPNLANALQRRRGMTQHDLIRYQYNPDTPHDPFTMEEHGDYVDASCYFDLKMHFDVLSEELRGYKHALCGAFAHESATPRQRPGYRQFVRRPKNDRVLRAQYGHNQGECDFFVLYGGRIPSCDRALIFHFFGSKVMSYNYSDRRPAFDPSLLDELQRRGYDLSTLRFSIELKQEASS